MIAVEAPRVLIQRDRCFTLGLLISLRMPLRGLVGRFKRYRSCPTVKGEASYPASAAREAKALRVAYVG